MKKRTLNQRILLVMILATGFAYRLEAQNVDSLFKVAREAAFERKDYATATRLSKEVLRVSPGYTDVVTFLGRLYTWNKQPDSARLYFNEALRQQPDSENAFMGLADMEYWTGNYAPALIAADNGLKQYPRSETLLLRKAQVLYAQKEYAAAIPVLDTLLQVNKKNSEARRLAVQIQDHIAKNAIGVKYDYVHFDQQFPDPWHLASIDYTRHTKAGAFTARVNYANRFATEGLQYELESYPRFSKTFYGYLNMGYSDNNVVFPKWKAGASLFANLPRAFEAELGVRYLYFNKDIFMYTLYAGKYYNSFLFGARTFLTPQTSYIAQTYSVMARYYFGGPNDYIGVLLGSGLSPDDVRSNVQLNSGYKMRNYNGEINARFSIQQLNIITGSFSLINQEYLPGQKGNQLQFGLGYIRRF